MTCDACREALSARLDGEDQPGESAAADAHMATCVACAQWWEDATAVTRLARLSVVASPMPAGRMLAPEHLTPEQLAQAAPGPGRHRAVNVLRWALGLLGLIQFVLGMTQVSLLSAGHDHASGVSPDHLWHESAAWNIAIGAGFGWIALRRSRPAPLLPLLTAFMGMLVLLSVNDILVGTVDSARLISHGFVAAGYLILVVLSRPGFDFGDPSGGRLSLPRWPLLGDAAPPEPAPTTSPGLRLVTRSWPVTSAAAGAPATPLRSDRAA